MVFIVKTQQQFFPLQNQVIRRDIITDPLFIAFGYGTVDRMPRFLVNTEITAVGIVNIDCPQIFLVVRIKQRKIFIQD